MGLQEARGARAGPETSDVDPADDESTQCAKCDVRVLQLGAFLKALRRVGETVLRGMPGHGTPELNGRDLLAEVADSLTVAAAFTPELATLSQLLNAQLLDSTSRADERDVGKKGGDPPTEVRPQWRNHYPKIELNK